MNIGRQISQRFAETMLFWRGYLKTKEVQEFAGVSERTARSLVSEWRTRGLLPTYKSYSERRLTPIDDFCPGSSVTSPEIIFSLLLMAEHSPGNPFSSTHLPEGGHDLSLSAAIPIGALQNLVAACLDQTPVSLVYASKTGRQEFIFCPSAIVRSRGRYHLRGYRSNGRDAFHRRLDDRYVDVVPARVVESRQKFGIKFVDLENDSDWQMFEEKEFTFSPELSEDEKICYEHEYGIAEFDVLKVRKRRALMPYVRQELSERRCWRRDGSSIRIWDIS